MHAQSLYDLLIEADKNATAPDLARLAFIIDSLPPWQWVVPLIREDAPQLAKEIGAPGIAGQERTLLKCVDLAGRDDYTGRVATMALDNLQNLRPDNSSVTRISYQPVAITPLCPAQDSVAQRLYNLITAMDAVDTNFNIGALAWDLHCFGKDVLDLTPLVQDAPRLQGRLSELAPDPWLTSRWGNMATSASDFNEGIMQIECRIEQPGGLLRDIARLFRQLLSDTGLIQGSDFRRMRHEQRVPLPLSVERRGAQQNYSCVYIWMIGVTGNLNVDNLGGYARDEDRELVVNSVQPCARIAPLARLQQFVVIAAGSLKQARNMFMQYNRDWDVPSAAYLNDLINDIEPRHVVLLDHAERPRIMFNWTR